MKIKHIFNACLVGSMAVAMVSCDKDGDHLTMEPPVDVEISGPTADIVLDVDNKDALALTLHWNANGDLSLSNQAVALPDGAIANTIMFSLTNEFADAKNVSVPDKQYSYMFSASELNEIVTGLGVVPGERTEVFVKVKTDIAKNLAPKYSNVLSLNVTPYMEKGAPQFVWLSGHDDAVSGSWHFNNYLRLYDEATKSYAACVQFASKWGYKIYNTSGEWHDCWTAASGATAQSGKVEFDGKTNIPAPDDGLYVLDFSVAQQKYKTLAVNKVSYAGLNDDWSITDMSLSETPGVYTATVTKSATTPYGVKILINGSWDYFFGGNGNAGELCYKHDGFEGDNGLANGQYVLTVDLINTTYNYAPVE